jgi:anion-transporting  ArsA/GET3 family ATPase
VAATVALAGAESGRRAVVVTIDPAKRLADALGVAALSNEPHRIEGDWPGELWALMLDTKTTFDALVMRYAASPGQAEVILANRFYRNISGALSGTQEYMAMEKLFELANDARFDLIVIDTPPTRNALDFLGAPRRLVRLLDSRIYRWLVVPTRAYMKAISMAAQAFLRTVSSVVGSEVVDDVVAFFRAFEGMDQGFRSRAEEMTARLTDPGTAFLLVSSPRRDSLEEAMFFADKLGESHLAVEALVLNRMHPGFGDGSADADRQMAATLGQQSPLGRLYANRAAFRTMAEGEDRQVRDLAGRVSPAVVARVPFLPGDVHDLEGLRAVRAHLF